MKVCDVEKKYLNMYLQDPQRLCRQSFESGCLPVPTNSEMSSGKTPVLVLRVTDYGLNLKNLDFSNL